MHMPAVWFGPFIAVPKPPAEASAAPTSEASLPCPCRPAARRLEPTERPAGHGSGAPHRTDQAGPRWVGVPWFCPDQQWSVFATDRVLQSFRSNGCHALPNRAVYRLCTGGTVEEVRGARRGGAGLACNWVPTCSGCAFILGSMRQLCAVAELSIVRSTLLHLRCTFPRPALLRSASSTARRRSCSWTRWGLNLQAGLKSDIECSFERKASEQNAVVPLCSCCGPACAAQRNHSSSRDPKAATCPHTLPTRW